MADDPVAQGWALKEACYAAWHREPPRTREAADAAAALALRHPQSPLPAIACWTDGIALFAEGRLVDALARLEQAEQAFEAADDAQHAAQTLVPQLAALTFLGREDDVVERGGRALTRFDAVGDDASAGKIEINVGSSLSRQDRHAEAEQAFRRAAARFEATGDAYLLAMADIGLANALTWQYRSAEALRAAARARRNARRGGHAILHAQTLQATGQIELNRGRWGLALKALARALRILEQAGAAPQRRMECEIALADAYSAVNLLDEALHLYRRVATEAEALPAPNETALATLQGARVLGRSGRFKDALADLGRARALYVKLGNTASTALVDLYEARLLLALARPADARVSARRAAAALADSGIRGWQLEATAVNAAALARLGQLDAAEQDYQAALAAGGDLSSVCIECRTGLAEVGLARRDWAAARSAAEQAVQLWREQRAALPSDEFRSAVGGEAERAHEVLIAAALAQGDAWRLLADIDQGRSPALADALAPIPDDDAVPESSAALRQLRQAWREAMADDNGSRVLALDAKIRDIERSLLDAGRRHALQSSAGARRGAGGSMTALLDVDAVQQTLGPRQAMVVFHRHGGRLLALTVTRSAVGLHEAASDGLVEHIAGLRLQVQAMRNPLLAGRHAAQLERRLDAHARALHAQLWAPVQRAVGDAEEVVVVPHGALHDLPFGLLHDGTGWLVQRHGLVLAPSVATWLTLGRRATRRGRPRVVAAGTAGPGLSHVLREIDAVAEVFGSGVELLRGEQATAEGVRAAASSGDVDVLHLACHGRFRADNPAFSMLSLADGPLPVHELSRWRLPASPIVLSACETGVSRVAPGDEAFGLVRAMLLAGARTVVATQWAVDDAATADLVRRFYRGLADGDATAQALRAAQCEAAAAGRHPYFWGAFAVHGAG